MASNASKEKKALEAKIRGYLQARSILIADTSQSCRSSVSRALVELGANTSKVIGVTRYEEALEEIQNKRPKIVIAEYNLGQKFGLDLLAALKEVIPQDDQRMFILATGNSSESAVAEAAEEDVDSYIIKPFTGDTLKKYLVNRIQTKLNPSEYANLIQEGKNKLAEEDPEGAIEAFEKAKAMAKTPSLACYYVGQAAETQNDWARAHAEYQEGLKHNDIHYKCLVGDFEVLQKLDQKAESYAVIQKLVKYFPVSPQRLGAMMRLAVHTANYEDVDKYFELFTNLDRRPPELVKTVVAALVICGKYLLQAENIERAVEVFKKASMASARNAKILTQIIQIMADENNFELAEDFLKMFDPEDQIKEEFKVIDFIVANGLLTPGQVVTRGKNLVGDGIKDSQVFEILIRRCLEIDKEQMAETFAYDAAQAFPEKKEYFLSMIEAN